MASANIEPTQFEVVQRGNSQLDGSKHITRSQKRCKMLDIINQNQTFIFLLPFKTIVIMAS
jgi:hypothetical protein